MTFFLTSLGATYSNTILNNHSNEATANNNTYLYLAKFAAFRISNYILNQQERMLYFASFVLDFWFLLHHFKLTDPNLISYSCNISASSICK